MGSEKGWGLVGSCWIMGLARAGWLVAPTDSGKVRVGSRVRVGLGISYLESQGTLREVNGT